MGMCVVAMITPPGLPRWSPIAGVRTTAGGTTRPANTGFGRFPSRLLNINAAWLELALTATDLLAWARTLLLEGELAKDNRLINASFS